MESPGNREVPAAGIARGVGLRVTWTSVESRSHGMFRFPRLPMHHESCSRREGAGQERAGGGT